MLNLSKNKIKLINSLKIKKYRNREKIFICEGEKIFEILVRSNLKIKEIFAISSFIEKNKVVEKYNFTEISENELKKSV